MLAKSGRGLVLLSGLGYPVGRGSVRRWDLDSQGHSSWGLDAADQGLLWQPHEAQIHQGALGKKNSNLIHKRLNSGSKHNTHFLLERDVSYNQERVIYIQIFTVILKKSNVIISLKVLSVVLQLLLFSYIASLLLLISNLCDRSNNFIYDSICWGDKDLIK